MALTDSQDIERIVRAVVQTLETRKAGTGPSMAAAEELPQGVFHQLDDAVSEAHGCTSFLKSIANRYKVIAAIRAAGEKHALSLAEQAVAETKMGRVQDKLTKNLSQARHTPGV